MKVFCSKNRYQYWGQVRITLFIMCIYTFAQPRSFACFISVRSLVRSFVRSVDRSCVRSVVLSFGRSFVRSVGRSVCRSLRFLHLSHNYQAHSYIHKLCGIFSIFQFVQSETILLITSQLLNQSLMIVPCNFLLQFLKSSERSLDDDRLQQFEEEKFKLLKAWRTYLIVCSSFQVLQTFDTAFLRPISR